MASSEYKLLQHQDLDLEEMKPPGSPYQMSHRSIRAGFTYSVILLFTSLSLNAIWAYQQLQLPSRTLADVPTSYAELRRATVVPFTIDKIYTSSNRTIADEAWGSPNLLPDTGLVAISDDWARSKNLPEAQRFPWDNSKGIYLLNGFHNMHCLHLLRRSTLQAFDGKPQTVPLGHIAHCLNALREDIMCNADDTPRYTGRLNQEASAKQPTSGIGQPRLCRDWSELEQWAVKHSACYRAINTDDPEFPPIERYKFCPNGERF